MTKLPYKHLYRVSGIEHYHGPLGCVVSHLILLNDFVVRQTANNVVILEDDIKFYDHTLRLGENYNRKVIYSDLYNDKSWDFILLTPSRYLKVNDTSLIEYLDYNENNGHYKLTNDLLFKLTPDHSTTSTGYITRRHYIDQIETNMINSYNIMFKYLGYMPTKYLDEAALDRQWISLAVMPDSKWYVLKIPIVYANSDFDSDINKFISVSHMHDIDISYKSTNEIVLHVPITIKGLGRHLFIVWAVIAYARQHNIHYTFWDMKTKPWKTYWYTFFKNIDYYYKPWPNVYYAYRSPNDFAYAPIESFNRSFTLSGYFQSHKHFDIIYDEIYSTIVTNANKSYSDEANSISKLIKSYAGTKKCIFVHINQNMKIMDNVTSINLSKEYYAKAIRHFDSDNFFVFLSNNHHEPKNEFIIEVENEVKKFTGNYVFIQNEKYENYVMMLAMIQMDGAIIANSAYSWWIAYLMDNHRNKTVVIPRIWYNNSITQIDKKLDHWRFP